MEQQNGVGDFGVWCGAALSCARKWPAARILPLRIYEQEFARCYGMVGLPVKRSSEF